MNDEKKNQYFSGNTNSFNVSNSYNSGGTFRRNGKPYPFPPGGFDLEKLLSELPGMTAQGMPKPGIQPNLNGQNIINGVIVPGGGPSKVSSAEKPQWKMNVEIGHGTFGMVFVEQVEVQRHGATESELWAVKRIPKGVASFPADRYMEEIALLGALKQNELFVKFIKHTEDSHHVYIAMEYLPLGDMSQSFKDKYKWGEHDAHVVIEQLIMGVAIMHKENIAHRDLKPENVFLWLPDPAQPVLRVKIGDFGTSKRVPVNNNTTFLNTTTGTCSYMAPEVDGNDTQSTYTRKVDVWALGCILYRALTGEVPFQSRQDVWMYSMGIKSPLAGVENIGLSQEAIDFLGATLQPKPRDRPSAEECLKLPWIINKPSSPHFRIREDLHKRLKTRQAEDLAKMQEKIDRAT
ncbi:kinase-like protein [Choiromyces venosus 120613-1]|uniref:non-specific serine/threonine protein kinase n=1 Tax=Choiromyces venosus 120613-1 TaxID=1336337 RepID=A0A3N4J2Z0_9PEZI|nr:kinase-like protein [Choiromyces venosus 120613-1]